uniref:Predicted protein n=1 Tax=Hordeum vulgare subsp. vulgare TaxID=112509 RepID=F2EK11_HORVV|nr:predicted protein [Hordeum vulgare subsp. vulgare]
MDAASDWIAGAERLSSSDRWWFDECCRGDWPSPSLATFVCSTFFFVLLYLYICVPCLYNVMNKACWVM